MTHKDLIKKLSEKSNVPQVTIDNILRQLTLIINEDVMAGEEITVYGLGKFKRKDTAERYYINPAKPDADKILKPASSKISFKPAKSRKDK